MNSLHVARFTVAYWCVFVAVLLPLVCAWLAKSGGFGKPRREGGYDNHDPRAWMARQTDGMLAPTQPRPTVSRRCRFLWAPSSLRTS